MVELITEIENIEDIKEESAYDIISNLRKDLAEFKEWFQEEMKNREDKN